MSIKNLTSYKSVHSLVKLIDAYEGDCILVRSSGGGSQAIGFNAEGNLDVVALKTFLGTNTGYLITYYDQKETYNLTNATEAQQPEVIITNQNVVYFKATGGRNLLCSSYCGALTNFTFAITWAGPLNNFTSYSPALDFSGTEFLALQWTVENAPTYYDGSSFLYSDSKNEDGAFKQTILKGANNTFSFHELGGKVSADTSINSPSFARLTVGKNFVDNGNFNFVEILLADTDIDSQELHDHFRLKYSLFEEVDEGHLVLGDSISTAGLSGLGTSWVLKLFTALGYTRFNNLSRGGITAQVVLNNYAEIRKVLRNIRAKQKSVIIFLGTNDIVLNAATGAQVNDLNEQLANLLREDGANKITVVTPLPRLPAGTASNAFNVVRLAAKDLMVANPAFDEVLDVTTTDIGEQGDQNNLTNYVDDVHMTSAGNQILADALESTIDSILNTGVSMGTKVLGSNNGGGSNVVREFLTSADVDVENTGATIFIPELSPDLGANKKYKLKWFVATDNTLASAAYRLFFNFPANHIASIVEPITNNPGDLQDSLTPADDQIAGQWVPGLQIGDAILFTFHMIIQTADAGNLGFGLRYVSGSGVGKVYKDISFVEVEEIG